jgi:hypothetical protein
MVSRIGLALTIGLSVTIHLFFFTYLPQLALVAITSGPLLAPISTALLVLSESSTIVNGISNAVLVDPVDTFDATLVVCNVEHLVTGGRGRQHHRGTTWGSKAAARLSYWFKTPWLELFFPGLISNLRYLVYLPLNMIPVVGSVLYVVRTGRSLGPSAHARYFQLKGWSVAKQHEWVEQNRAAYTR